MTGSSPLTPEQQDWYADRFGERYVAVQENHVRPSRRIRRAKKGKRHAPVTEADVAAYELQKRAQRQLRDAQMRPVL